jgi:3-phosphoshikimate 1-carboxyvinyltransferase
MERVIIPLTKMGAYIRGRNNNLNAPLYIQGQQLYGITYHSPVASAQVKSAILLAGLTATGATTVVEPMQSRDHTERMLQAFGANIAVEDLKVTLEPGQPLRGQDISIPGDISSAAFFLVAALIVPGSELLIKNVCVNPTRTGILKALHAMGANIQILCEREETGEPVADLRVRYSPLRGITVEPQWIPSLIDEIPILAVAASLAQGTTIIRGAGELRLKETDRIKAMARELSRFGVQVEEVSDGMIITGTQEIVASNCDSYGDHRIAMAMAILALRAAGTTTITNAAAVNVSFPNFFETLQTISGQVRK